MNFEEYLNNVNLFEALSYMAGCKQMEDVKPLLEKRIAMAKDILKVSDRFKEEFCIVATELISDRRLYRIMNDEIFAEYNNLSGLTELDYNDSMIENIIKFYHGVDMGEAYVNKEEDKLVVSQFTEIIKERTFNRLIKISSIEDVTLLKLIYDLLIDENVISVIIAKLSLLIMDFTLLHNVNAQVSAMADISKVDKNNNDSFSGVDVR